MIALLPQFATMPVSSLAEDKPKIVFHAAMMAIQNFGFFNMCVGRV